MTSTLISLYKPNMNDPRVRRRIEPVLAWCEQFVGSKRGKSIPSEEVMRVFGNYGRPGLARWLRANLLQEVASHRKGEQNNRYTVKKQGYRKVYAMLGEEAPSDLEILQRRYANLLAGAVIEYRDNGLRRYNEFQNIKRDLRKELCAGWWDYDIEACAPTLLHQYASKHHQQQHGDGPEPFPALARLVNDKQVVREHVAAATGLDIQKTKELLTMLLFKASVVPHYKAALFSMLGEDKTRLHDLLSDPYIAEFRADVERMWDHAFRQYDGESSASATRPRKKSKLRMRVYLTLERRVMDAMLERLAQVGETPILMHDGFMSRRQIDADEMVRAAQEKTGFAIRLSEARLGSIETADELDVEDMMRGVSCDD